MIDSILDALDAPRRSLWNLGQGIAEGDWRKALPGGLGVLGGALAATGIGLPAGIALGSLAGGLGQMGGEATGRENFKAPTADEVGAKLSDAMGVTDEGFGRDALKFAGGALTDPLTYAGGIGGARAGGRLGKSLEEAASLRGPRYATTMEDLQAMATQTPRDKLMQQATEWGNVNSSSAVNGGEARYLKNAIEDNPGMAKILGEIQPGSKVLGSGVEGVAFRTPAGDVIRIGQPEVGFKGRPVDESILQPTRAIHSAAAPSAEDGLMTMFGRMPREPARGVMVERMPFAKGVDSEALREHFPAMREGMKSRGLDFWDEAVRNAGFHNGKPVVIDPGAVDAVDYAGKFAPMVNAAHEPGPISSALLSLLRSDKAMQRALESGRSGVNYERPGRMIGGGIGAALGQH